MDEVDALQIGATILYQDNDIMDNWWFVHFF
jgi:hypothetical protein